MPPEPLLGPGLYAWISRRYKDLKREAAEEATPLANDTKKVDASSFINAEGIHQQAWQESDLAVCGVC